MIYFNLDLMEKDAQRRLAKTIDASVKTQLAEFAEFCEIKPVVSRMQVFDSRRQMENSYGRPFIIHAGIGGSGCGQQLGGAGIGSWSGL